MRILGRKHHTRSGPPEVADAGATVTSRTVFPD
jgi:hypothetical protein